MYNSDHMVQGRHQDVDKLCSQISIWWHRKGFLECAMRSLEIQLFQLVVTKEGQEVIASKRQPP